MVILHTNDLHGKLDKAAALSIAELRRSADFYFDCGDCIKTGNIGVPKRPETAWDLLARAGCTAGVPGNREFHISEAGFRAKLAGCRHPLFASNLIWRGKSRKPLLSLFKNVPSGDLNLRPLPPAELYGAVGVFGVMVPMVTEKMAARRVSAFINTSPIEAARSCVDGLRPMSETIICLSHIGLQKDIELAESVPGVDLILGGHSHETLYEPLRIRDTWICQSGSHARFVGRYVWDGGVVEAELLPL